MSESLEELKQKLEQVQAENEKLKAEVAKLKAAKAAKVTNEIMSSKLRNALME